MPAPPASFLKLALSPRVVRPAVKVALLVGTILALINHGEAILALSVSRENLFKILLTYLVPYSVATYSAVRAIQGSQRIS